MNHKNVNEEYLQELSKTPKTELANAKKTKRQMEALSFLIVEMYCPKWIETKIKVQVSERKTFDEAENK